MRVLVAWSGGVDSTALVYRLLRQNHYVTSVYVKIPANGEKVNREETAIKNMLPYFKDFPLNHLGSSEINLIGGSPLILKQPAIWMLALLYACHCEIDEVNIAYVLNDCAISYLNDIQMIWSNYQGLMEEDRTLSQLRFPLAKVDKQTLWNELPQELRKHVTWCEDFKKSKPVCDCQPCKRMEPILALKKRKVKSLKKG